MEERTLKGRQAIAALAKRFPQLFVVPADDAQEAYRMAAGRGIRPADASLDHFVGSPEDELRVVETPAGPVEVLFLWNRVDFETFLQIVGHRAQPVPIARTVGAITYRGLADWQSVAAAREEYLAAGGDDWRSEFARQAARPGAFRSEIVVISEGPYSNIPACDTPYGPDEWLHISREIRLHHECAHVVCRRTMPDDILPIWDEITADVVGLLCATGRYEAALASRFLGVSKDGFAGGRLVEYLTEEQAAQIDDLARQVHEACLQIEEQSGPNEAEQPFSYLIDLKRHPLVLM